MSEKDNNRKYVTWVQEKNVMHFGNGFSCDWGKINAILNFELSDIFFKYPYCRNIFYQDIKNMELEK